MARGCLVILGDCFKSSINVILDVWTLTGFSINGWLSDS